MKASLINKKIFTTQHQLSDLSPFFLCFVLCLQFCKVVNNIPVAISKIYPDSLSKSIKISLELSITWLIRANLNNLNRISFLLSLSEDVIPPPLEDDVLGRFLPFVFVYLCVKIVVQGRHWFYKESESSSKIE